MTYYSHPGKLLEVHTIGVRDKYLQSCHLPIGNVAALFHDTGKINPNFQVKVNSTFKDALNEHIAITYSHHAYLSVVILYRFRQQNKQLLMQLLDCENEDIFKIRLLQTIALIAHHHGNLPDFSNLLSKTEVVRAAEFIANVKMPSSLFIMQQLKIQHKDFELYYDEKLFTSLPYFDAIKHANIWQPDALLNFMQTQFAFAALIEADKRDAGNNEQRFFKKSVNEANIKMAEKLNTLFNSLDSLPDASELNKFRTAIRKEAVGNVFAHMHRGIRVFTLTAPTGAGKTFTLLSIAAEIQKQNPGTGILYALPFLSITEQVKTILQNLEIDCLPVTSKSQNDKLEEAQKTYENNPTNDNLKELAYQSFAEDTFDNPFILTTFVQFFETLISNKNSTLLKLPNFSNRIFLIDEVQALPPRLYIFFTAWLQAFCEQNNSYVVLSTGTMPKFQLPDKKYAAEQALKNPALLFKNYTPDKVVELIAPEKYFSADVFNRYKINLVGDDNIMLEELAVHISSQADACLVILNTIADTKELFNLLKSQENCILLNTHFVPVDRLTKIAQAKQYLAKGEKVVLISTQLIEAGVDIDFPVVYRDLCPLPSLIQSAGRCNRNKKIPMGQVYFFHLTNKEGKSSAALIYRKEAARFLDFCKNEIKHGVFESELFQIQSRFFESIKNDLTIGEFTYYIDQFGNEKKYNFIECINRAEFEKAGRFQLIIESEFGNQYQYYIKENAEDDKYDLLVAEMKICMAAKTFEEKMPHKIKMETLLKVISNRLITVRIRNKETAPQFSNVEEYFGIRILTDLLKYSPVTGIDISNENCIL